MQKNMRRELFFPQYELLAQEKINCYPAAEDLTITERSAKIKLQALMDLTSKRLVSTIDTSSVDVNEQLILTSQWGFDRSSSHSVWQNEKFQTGDYSELVYNFMICVVPLSLKSKGVTIWKNEQPSSLSFCRPILFKFMNNTKENVQAELATIEAEIEALTPTSLADGITVTHQMTLTMIDDEYLPITEDTLTLDGRTVSHQMIDDEYLSITAAGDTVASVCQICKANITKTNPHLQSVKLKTANKDVHKNGLSALHAWTRSMESLLEISYRLENKSWHENSMDEKYSVMWHKTLILLGLQNKHFVLKPLEQMLDSVVYKGRSARTFFEQTDYFSCLTNIDFELLRRIQLILLCISSGRKIMLPKFQEFCSDTAKHYMELYPWYPMPSPLHTLLIHGPDFVENMSIIPIGMLCEDITERMDIKFRKCGLKDHSGIFNRASWNEKLFRRLILSSDPVLGSIQPKVQNSSFKEFHILTGSEHEYDDCY